MTPGLKIFIILILLIPFHARSQNKTTYQFYSSSELNQETKSDILGLLKKATSDNWEAVATEQAVKTGFILKIEIDPNFKARESFHLQTNGNSNLTLTSASAEGLLFGIYKHLRTLGFRFYLPGELYSIIPKISNPFGPKKNIYDGPFAQIRDFGGTGGFGTANPDADQSVEKDWNLWRNRNGFGAAYPLAGHRGEDFILENKKILKQHPEWLVSPLTGNDFQDQGIKLNYFNKDAVDFYTDWTIARFTDKSYHPKPPNFTELVSIEPSDGGGFLTKSGGKIISPSDQVYAAANLAAKKLDKLFPNHPNIGVNLYAYSSHAVPPSFPLHPRVFIQLVPYQFQNVALGPSFIKMWSEKVKRFGIYDYFKYADAQWDLPGGITLEETMLRLIHSSKSGSEGTMFETSYSKFSTGIPLWIIVRYLADGDANWKNNLTQVTNDLYQSASLPVNKMFNLFYSEVSFSKGHLANASNYLEQASKASSDPLVQKRLLELKQYLYFTNLVYNSREVQKGSLKDRFLPVADYAWKIYENGIIHSYRIMQLVAYNFLNSDKSSSEYQNYYQLFLKWFPETERSKTEWSSRPQGESAAEIENNFTRLRKLYSIPLENSSYEMDEVVKALSTKFQPKRDMNIGGNYSARGFFGVYSNKPVTVKIRYSLSGNSNPRLNISGIDTKYQHAIAYTIEKPEGEISFTIPAGETKIFLHAEDGVYYRMNIQISDGLIFFNGSPRGIMNFYKYSSDPLSSYTNDPVYFPSYFFLPKNTSVLNYKVQLNSLRVSFSGKELPTKLLSTENAGFETRQLNVPAENSGKIWKSVIQGNYSYNMINIPDRYFLLQEK